MNKLIQDRPSQEITRSRRIGFLIYPDCDILDVCGPCDAFHYANYSLLRFGRTGELGYQCDILAATPGPVRTSCGIELVATPSYSDKRDGLDTLIAVGGPYAEQACKDDLLKITIPKEIWSNYLCLIVHPGVKGDRGPSSLDWAIANHEKSWGVSILEAADEFDAGPIWASHEFALEENPPAKSSLYRGQVTEAAVRGVLEAVARIESGAFRSGAWRPEKLTDVAPYGAAVCARRCGRPTAPSTGCGTQRP